MSESEEREPPRNPHQAAVNKPILEFVNRNAAGMEQYVIDWWSVTDATVSWLLEIQDGDDPVYVLRECRIEPKRGPKTMPKLDCVNSEVVSKTQADDLSYKWALDRLEYFGIKKINYPDLFERMNKEQVIGLSWVYWNHDVVDRNSPSYDCWNDAVTVRVGNMMLFVCKDGKTRS